jgi:hypothetical protein
MPGFEDVLTGLGIVSNWVKQWGTPLAAIGGVSMALIQVAKNTLPWRSNFQRKTLREWLASRNGELSGAAEADLIRLTTAGDEQAFYDSDIEDICTRIKSAVAVLLDYPNLHEPLLRCLASHASQQDIECILHPPRPDWFYRELGLTRVLTSRSQTSAGCHGLWAMTELFRRRPGTT